jgi:hypothetical protein
MDIKRILQLQGVFNKTPSGRFIGKSLIAVIDNSINNPELTTVKMIKCSNCGLVLDEQYFSDGCKNCGSKDFELIN